MRSRRSPNKEFARIMYFFVLLFIALIGYLVYFNMVQARDIVNSPYNGRQDYFAERVVRGDITDKDGVVLAETQVAEDGTETRVYPYGSTFAHVVGYSSQEYGKSGLEAAMNFELLTSNAFFVEKIKNEFQDKKHIGDTIVTTLDSTLQQAAAQAMGYNKGAVVVLEASTGRILTMYSNSTFDPNQIDSMWEYLNTDEENSPLLNRATQGLYAPGSTFKIVTTLEYMREHKDYRNYWYECSGSHVYGETTIPCNDMAVHGGQDLRSSFANSCNSSFASIGLSLNKEKYRNTAEDLLFNKKLPCIMDYSKGSFVVNKSTGYSEMMMTAMGQGKTLVSPYHMALITSAIANGGNLMEPYLVERITNYTGTEISDTMPKRYKQLMTPEEAAELTNYMTAVVNEGTGTLLSGAGYTVAGKTGTAEYSMDNSGKAHSWFVGFTNVDNPDIVVSVIVEGYDGNPAASAVPIAKQVMDVYYANR